ARVEASPSRAVRASRPRAGSTRARPPEALRRSPRPPGPPLAGLYREHQWFADRLGIAVLTIDGRGTPGGVMWEKAVHRDFSVTLDDQIDGLHAAADRWPFLDLDHVAIRGWSFGGELAGFAVLKRPDVFHAAIAGAPVT